MKKRIISAIIMILITFPIILIGNIPFIIFNLILGEITLHEFLKLQKKIPLIISIFSHIMIGIIILKDILNISLDTILISSLFLYFAYMVFIDHDKYNYKKIFLYFGITVFLGICFSKVILIRNLNLNTFIYLLLISVFTDSFALITGRKFGHHKLAEKISPNKTVEGLIGGVLIGTLVGSIWYLIFVNINSNIFIIILLTLILSLIGEFGDLVKSCIKRYEKIKDFSNLIPGHGGIMDRVDSFVFIVIFYNIILSFGGLI